MEVFAAGLSLLVALADVNDSGPFGGEGGTRRSARIETWWDGLPPSRDRGPASGLVALRQPLDRRVRISGGRFVMGSTKEEMKAAIELCSKEPLGEYCRDRESQVYALIWSEGLEHSVTLNPFDLDRTEVSVEKYGRCVAAGACAPPSFAMGDPRYDVPSFPVTHVRWQDADAYCHWVSGRLPTEAEWELAATGPSGHLFPWGRLYNARLSNHGVLSGEPTDGRDGFVGLAPIGSFPDGATPTGLLDMAGNAREWVFDWFELEEGHGYRGAAQTNPKGPSFGDGHVVRGGSYRSGAHELRAAARYHSSLASREIGFRCAYDP